MANSQSLNSAGYGLYEKKEYAEAVRFFREAAYVDPANAYPHYNLACTLSLIRDSIWADPAGQMRYDNIYNKDYYADVYQLYEPESNYNYYAHQPRNDELCRNELFEHLTLSCLQNRNYLKKAPVDPDLAGVRNTLRFKRLMENLRTGEEHGAYGIWHVPEQMMKACYFMLDGSMQDRLPNDRPGTDCYIPFYENYEARLVSVQTTGTFTGQITGYEGFAWLSPHETYQWGQEGLHLVFYTVTVEGNPANENLSSKKPDYDYTVYRHVTDIEMHNMASFRLDEGYEYLRMTLPPYSFILLNDSAGLRQYLVGSTPDARTLNALAVNALIYDRADTLDWLLATYPEIDRGLIFLRSCLYVKHDIFTALEGGSYGFDIDTFIEEQGAAMFNHAAASGDAAFFETLYAKYFDRVVAPLSEQDARHFKEGLFNWSDTTGNIALFDILLAIERGKYHDDF
jgi:hypothetical protein